MNEISRQFHLRVLEDLILDIVVSGLQFVQLIVGIDDDDRGRKWLEFDFVDEPLLVQLVQIFDVLELDFAGFFFPVPALHPFEGHFGLRPQVDDEVRLEGVGELRASDDEVEPLGDDRVLGLVHQPLRIEILHETVSRAKSSNLIIIILMSFKHKISNVCLNRDRSMSLTVV